MSGYKDYGVETVPVDNLPFTHEGKTYGTDHIVRLAGTQIIADMHLWHAEHMGEDISLRRIAAHRNSEGFEDLLAYPYGEWLVRFSPELLAEILVFARPLAMADARESGATVTD